MSNLLFYKNYNGTVEYSKEDNCLFGKVIGIKSLLSYEGVSVKELEENFRDVIDEYLEDCKKQNVDPEQSYKGTFNVRMERRIPFEITADADPFYSESNIRYLEHIMTDIEAGKAHFAEHELMED